MIRKNKKWFGYILYGILIAAGLLYFRFPSEALKDYLQAKAERSNSGFDLSIGNVSPSLPLGLKLLRTEFSQNANPNRIIFRADSIIVRPAIGSLLRGKLKLCFDGLAYDGALKGCARFGEMSLQAPFSTTIELKDIRIGEYDLPNLIGRHVEGSLGGTIIYDGKYHPLREGSGEADLRLTEGRFQLMQPILSLESIDFNEVSIKMVLQDQKINLTRVEMEGPTMRGTLSGVIRLRKEFLDSSLDLRGTIEPFADFFASLPGTQDTVKLFKQRLKRGTLSFVIRGTLTEPSIKFT